MKKTILGLAVSAVALAGAGGALAIQKTVSVAAAGTDYDYVEDFSEYPENDWRQCTTAGNQVGNSSAYIAPYQELRLQNTNGNSQGQTDGSVYLGSVYLINPDVTDYTDFTFTMKFRITQYRDAARWFGVMYRMRMVGNAPSGYVAAYRMNGNSHYTANSGKVISGVTGGDHGYKDSDAKTAGYTNALTDGKYHTVTITMSGNTATHYMDGVKIRDAVTSDKDEVVGAERTSGGFALILNFSAINIASCTIQREVVAPSVTEPEEVYGSVVSTYQNPDVKIVNAPTVVCDVTDRNVLESLQGTEKPSNAILHLNRDCNIVDANETVLGSFTEIYESLNNAVIPVIHVGDEGAADALIACLNDSRTVLDMAVMSADPALVKKVRTACPHIRGIISYDKEDFYTNGEIDLYSNIVGKTNANLANVVAIPESMATPENVRYIQARFKTVWVVADGTKSIDLYTCINSGAYGVISSDFGAVYDALESYPENSYTRMSYNVAHRASFSNIDNPSVYPTENSIGAVNTAIGLGASHLELDVHLTKDGHIVVMHDPSIDRTTTGTGNIGDMTLAEIQEYTLKDGQHIPVLEEVFEILEQNKDVVLVLELKAGATITEKIKALIGSGEGQYDVLDQLVMITFNNSGDDLLTAFKNELPTVPTAYLMSGNGPETLQNDLVNIGWYNSGVDIGYSATVAQAAYNKACLTDRGIANWYWTFSTQYAIVEAAELGHTGITNNAANVLMNTVYKVEGVSGQKVQTLAAGDEVSVRSTTYLGATQTITGKVFFAEQVGNYWNVIVSYTFTNANARTMTLYTAPFVIGDPSYIFEETDPTPDPDPVPDPDPDPIPDPDEGNGGDKNGDKESEGESGCNGSIAGGFGVGLAACCLAAGASGAVLVTKKKKK